MDKSSCLVYFIQNDIVLHIEGAVQFEIEVVIIIIIDDISSVVAARSFDQISRVGSCVTGHNPPGHNRMRGECRKCCQDYAIHAQGKSLDTRTLDDEANLRRLNPGGHGTVG